MTASLLLPFLASLWMAPGCGTVFCDCMIPGSVAAEREAADAVFAGTVVRVGTTLFTHPLGRRAVTFRVDRAWKGVRGHTVTIVTGWGGGDCGFPFERGGRYLVYARRWGDAPWDALVSGICDRTAELSAANADLRELGAPARTWPGADGS